MKSSTFKAAKQQVIEKFEKDFIIDRLADSTGNISQAVRPLEWTSKTSLKK